MLRKKSTNSTSDPSTSKVKCLDEVKNFLDGRYACASEATWRVFSLDIHSRWPSVDRLPIHLPGEKHINFPKNADLEKVCEKASSKPSKLEGWFVANKELPHSRNFTYAEFPSHFTWIAQSSK